MTDTEQVNQTFRTTNLSIPKVIAASPSISPEHTEKLKTLSKDLRFKLESKFTYKTTHLIVPSNEDKVAPDDAIYYEALLSGVWIVTWDWIEESLKAGDLIDEEEFQVKIKFSETFIELKRMLLETKICYLRSRSLFQESLTVTLNC